jgi:uncharacterized protein (TIGR03435 family)
MCMRCMRRVFIDGTLALLAVGSVFGQAVPDKLQFEVVSITPTQPVARGGGYNLSRGRLTAKNQSLRDLVKFSFDLQDYQLTGGARWMETDRYEVVATYPGETTGAERRRMMQAMLADRFSLAIHRESKETPGFALIVGRNGAKLKAAGPGDPGMMLGRDPKTGQRTLTATGAKMAGFAAMLATILSRPVEDKTGLDGVFDFTIEWTPDDTQSAIGGPGKGGQEEPAGDPAGASLSSAIGETLGLALKTQKAPIEVVVIDHAEKPSGN